MLKLLVTADWQADWENLDLCRKAAEEVLSLVKEHELDYVIFAGDLKRHYNPVDVRVTQFWTDFLAELDLTTKAFLLLGNHDRVGMYSEATNWLPILHRAGATPIHQGARVFSRDGTSLCFLPFSSSREKTKRWANELSKNMPTNRQNVLFFHNDIRGCKYNVLGAASTGKLTSNDLHADEYDYCFGGHVHLRQDITGNNCWYVGSPFATDWGEANQTKGYTLLIGKEMKFIQSKIPGWYDPSWPKFPHKKENWNGCRIRLKVPLEVGQNYPAVLEKTRHDAERKYPGAIVFTIPDFKEQKSDVIEISSHDSDKDKITAYVEETLPESLRRSHENGIIRFLAYKLKKASEGLGLRKANKIEFIKATAHNFLSYKDLEISFEGEGLRLVTSTNFDWMGRSNGGGKSNFLQTVPVALFGKTFKEQKHNAWANSKRKGKAWVSLKFNDGHNRVAKVTRVRRPGKLRFWVNGKEQSSGMQSTSHAGTQGLVEKHSGFTWQTLANAVYIDQEQVATFLNGTGAEQKKILERFQNLERFVAAMELVKTDLGHSEEALEAAKQQEQDANVRIKTIEDIVKGLESSELDETLVRSCKEAWLDSKKALREGHELVREKGGMLSRKIARLDKETDRIQTKRDNVHVRMLRQKARIQEINATIEQGRETVGVVECPMCFSQVDPAHIARHIKKLEREKVDVLTQLQHDKQIYEDLAELWKETHDRSERATDRRLSMNDNIIELQRDVIANLSAYRGAKKRWSEYESRMRHFEKRIKKAQKDVEFWRKQSSILDEDRQVMEYCVKAFSRNGIPAFLNAQICPELNKQAKFYSDVFTDSEIQVRFSVAEAEFNVEIINAHGGKGIGDQSAGEKKMAAIIASFALRSIAPACNLLVLDEPGDGLDATNAKAFASGLKRLKDDLGTVFLTTHNPVILAELSGEDVIRIEKRGGISRVVAE